MAQEQKHSIPMEPGYYWAKWRMTHEGDDLTPSNKWEIVQVNVNGLNCDPGEDEALSVSVPGVRETQWRDCFVWGEKVAELCTARHSGNVADAWDVLKRWLAEYEEEERTFSRYRDDVILDGVMTAAERRSISAALGEPK